MGRSNGIIQHNEQRDAHIIRDFEDALRLSNIISKGMSPYDLVAICPAPRAWVSSERVNKVIRCIEKDPKALERMSPQRRALFAHLLTKVQEFKKQHPDKDYWWILDKVVHSQSPNHFLTAGSIKVIISRARRKAREKLKNEQQ